MTGVLYACAAGLCFGAVNITMRRALARVADVDAGSAVITLSALALILVLTLVSGSALDPAELWPFMLLGAFVPGISQLLVVHAVQAAGASRAGILFGMAPLFSALIAVAVFDEPLRATLALGTLLVVGGGVVLAWERERPLDYRAYGAALAVTVAAAFGVRDNVARAVGDDIEANALSQSTAIMLGAALVLTVNLLRQQGALWRLRRAAVPFASSGLLAALAQLALFAALERARVTVVAPLAGTGVLWTVVFAALFLGRSELVGRRLFLVALLVVAGGTLVGVTK